MTYNCEFIDQGAQPTLSIRTTTSIKELPQELGRAYGAIGQYMAQLGEQPAGAPYAAYFTFEMSSMDIEIGFPVGSSLPGKDEIQSGEIPLEKSHSACIPVHTTRSNQLTTLSQLLLKSRVTMLLESLTSST